VQSNDIMNEWTKQHLTSNSGFRFQISFYCSERQSFYRLVSDYGTIGLQLNWTQTQSNGIYYRCNRMTLPMSEPNSILHLIQDSDNRYLSTVKKDSVCRFLQAGMLEPGVALAPRSCRRRAPDELGGKHTENEHARYIFAAQPQLLGFPHWCFYT